MSHYEHVNAGKKASQVCKKKKVGFYGISKKDRIKTAIRVHKLHPKLIEKVHDICKENKTAFWDKKVCSKGGKTTHLKYPNFNKKIAEIQRKNNTGFFNSRLQSELGKKGGKKAIKTHKKLNICLFNPKHYMQKTGGKKGGKIGGPISASILRKNKKYVFKNVMFDSMTEREIGVNIYYQFSKLIENKNFQVLIGSLSYDFLIEKYKCFVEYHPILKFLNYKEKSDKDYYYRRRKNLDKNGYKKYNLIVIK